MYQAADGTWRPGRLSHLSGIETADCTITDAETGHTFSEFPLDKVALFDPKLVGRRWDGGDESNFDLSSLNPELFEEEDETPWADMAHAQRVKLVRQCVAIINEVNAQVEVRRSSIKRLPRDANYGVFAKVRLRKGLVVGPYRGRIIGRDMYDQLYPTGHPRYRHGSER